MLMLMCSVSLTSCADRRVVIVHDSDLIRVGPGIVGKAYIWNTAEKDWELSENDVAYPQGAYVTQYHAK